MSLPSGPTFPLKSEKPMSLTGNDVQFGVSQQVNIHGPIGKGRQCFIQNVKLFEPNIYEVPIVIDDVNRVEEKILADELSKYLNKPYIVLDGDKGTGYIK